MEKDRHLRVQVDTETHKKSKNLAEYDGRSINGKVLYLIRRALIKHEEKGGTKIGRKDFYFFNCLLDGEQFI